MNKRSFSMFRGFLSVLIFVTLLTGCGGTAATATPVAATQALEVELILDPDISDVLAGQTVALNVEASGQGLEFEWSVSRGMLSASNTPAVIYTAPNTAGLDTVSVEVSSTTSTTSKSVIFNVIVPPTETLIPTIAPTDTPPPLPLFEIFGQAEDGKEFTFMNDGGTVQPEFVGEEDCVHSGIYGIQLTYDMPGQGSGGWGVHWINLPAITHLDASEFETLTFWVRGLSGGELFQVSMKDTNNREFWIESRSLLVVKKDWTMVSIPLEQFAGVNTSSVENMAFGFNSNHASGSICIDDIAFQP